MKHAVAGRVVIRFCDSNFRALDETLDRKHIVFSSSFSPSNTSAAIGIKNGGGNRKQSGRADPHDPHPY